MLTRVFLDNFRSFVNFAEVKEYRIRHAKASSNPERIVRLVPKRNVETWILWLTEGEANEETDYNRTGHDGHERIPQASKRLFQLTGANAALPENCIDSLRKGVSELIRLQF
jgi:hypothetical protein